MSEKTKFTSNDKNGLFEALLMDWEGVRSPSPFLKLVVHMIKLGTVIPC